MVVETKNGHDPRKESLMREKYGFTEPSVLGMIKKLEDWQKVGLIDKEPTREELDRQHERVMKAQIRQLEGTLDLEMRFKNPVPYDNRGQDIFFSSAINAIRTARDEDWAKGEPRQWLDRMAIDLTWGQDTQKLLEGMGGVLDKFYNWQRMLYWVQERMRSDPTASFYEGSYQKELPGMGISEISEKEGGRSLKEWGGGEREKALKYQDECTFWRMAVAEVHQMSEGKPSFMKDSEGKGTLSETEIQLIREVFEDKEQRGFAEEDEWKLITRKKDPYTKEQIDQFKKDGWLIHEEDGVVQRELFNWYSMGSKEYKKRYYLAAMETLLVMPETEKGERKEKRSVKELLKEYIAKGEGNKIKELTEEVRDLAKKRVENWRGMDISSDQALAREIVRAGIVQDWGHFTSTRLGWGWKYSLKEVEDKDGNKKLEVVRTRVGGGTTVATDVISIAYWRDYIAANEGKPRTIGMFPPMSDEYRIELKKNRPDWTPEYLVEVAQKDQKLQRAFKEMWEESDWDPTVKEELKKLVWYWETPYEDKGDVKIVIPIFFPPEIASLNFFDTISLSGRYDIKTRIEEDGEEIKRTKGNPSIWDELCAGEVMSGFDWSKMGDQALYRWMITIGQIVRYTTVMVDPESAANEGQFKDFFGDVGHLREFLKRADLGPRDEKEPTAILTMSLVPLLISLRTADKYGMIGASGYDKDERKKWLEEIAWWETKLSGMPKKLGKIKKYSQGMVHLLRFYTKIIARLAVVAGREEVNDLQNSYNSLREEVKSMGVDIPASTPRPPQKRRYEEERR